MPDLSRYRKGVTAFIGVLFAAAALYFPGDPDVAKALTMIVTIATAVGVVEVPNAEVE